MTWNTSTGKRQLGGAEAVLFSAALESLLDTDDDDNMFGDEGLNNGCTLIVGPFQDLSNHDKYIALEQIAKGLLTSADMAGGLHLNAVYESAIYYVFAWVQSHFDEVEHGVYVWGEQIVAAVQQCLPAGDDDNEDSISRLSMKDIDRAKWTDALEMLADRILWDRDFEHQVWLLRTQKRRGNNCAPSF